jgi:hypothetical protein
MLKICNRTEICILTLISILGLVAPALGQTSRGHMGLVPVLPRSGRPGPVRPVRPSFVPGNSIPGLTGSRINGPLSRTRINVVNSPSGLNPQLPPGTILTPGLGTNGFGLTGFNNASLSPTAQFLLLQQAALNASISPEVTLPFLGIPTGVSPFGLSPLLPQGLTSLLPPGINVALPTPVINPFVPVINPFFGVNPFIAGVANPLLLSAQLNPLVALNLAPRRPIVIVSPRTSLLVSPSMFVLGASGINSLPLVGLGSLAAGGMTTPATLPFVVALNSEINLTPEEEKELQRKINLVKSQTGASPATVWSGADLNVLLDDFKVHQDRRGVAAALSEDVLRHINIVSSKEGSNAGLFQIGPWPELLQKLAFQEERERIGSLISELIQQAKTGKIHAANLDALDMNLSLIGDRLADKIREVPTVQYVRAKRFLADLEKDAKSMRQPDAATHFSRKYDPKAKSIGELLQYMAKNDLRFSPAMPGDEGAYLVLYRALAIYDVSANLPATFSGSQMAAK